MNPNSNIRVKFDALLSDELVVLLHSQFTFDIPITELTHLYGATTDSYGKFYRGSTSIESFNYYSELPVLSLSKYLHNLRPSS